jgi:hypothetical protein
MEFEWKPPPSFMADQYPHSPHFRQVSDDHLAVALCVGHVRLRSAGLSGGHAETLGFQQPPACSRPGPPTWPLREASSSGGVVVTCLANDGHVDDVPRGAFGRAVPATLRQIRLRSPLDGMPPGPHAFRSGRAGRHVREPTTRQALVKGRERLA